MPKKRTFYSEEERKAHHEKKQREADLQIQELTKHWENDPKDIAEYLAFSTQFYKYSSRNTMLIYRQRPDSVFIASYTHWKELGYYVQEGEHGANIYRPETTRYFKPNVPNPTWVLLSKAMKLKSACSKAVILPISNPARCSIFRRQIVRQKTTPSSAA